MLQISLVESSKVQHPNSELEPSQEFTDKKLNAGTQVLLKLTKPWVGTESIVCSDSAFTSVQSGSALIEKGLRFTGVVKNATKLFSLTHMAQKVMKQKGDYITMPAGRNGQHRKITLISICWMDKRRKYFLSTVGNSICTAEQERVR